MPAVVEAQYIFATNNGTLTIKGYTGSGGVLVIPETISGLPVTSIGARAFLGATNLTSVTVPNSVLAIGDYAFANCTNLIQAQIGAGVTSIGWHSFLSCANLDTLTVDALNPHFSSADGVLFNRNQTTLVLCPSGKTGSYAIPDTVTTIGVFAFFDNLGLTNIMLPRTVTNILTPNGIPGIGSFAFAHSPNLNAITVDGSNPVFGSEAGVLFDKNQVRLIVCPNQKAGSFVVPDGVGSIAHSAFIYCSNLTSVTIPDSVTSIESGAFVWCTSLTNITIGSGVTNIDSSAFFGCTNLNNISVAALNSNYSTLNGCLLDQTQTQFLLCLPGATGSFAIPGSVTDIAARAFNGITGLTNIIIPNSVTNIEGYAFAQCPNLAAVTVTAENPRYSDREGVLFNKDQTTLVFCPEAKAGSYVIPDTVTNFEYNAFPSGISLTNVTIGSNVSDVGSPFIQCGKLNTITVVATNSTYSSWDGVLFDKSRTTLIEYPQAKIGSYTIPDGVTRLEDEAFFVCSNVTSLILPDSVTSIGMALYNSTGLTNITLGKGISDIDSSSFANCPSLASIIVDALNPNYSSKDGVLFDHNQTELIFCPRGKADRLMVPGSVTNIGYDAFPYDSGVKTISVDALNPVYSSRDGVLFNKSGSTLLLCPPDRNGDYQVPDAVTRIDNYAFFDCSHLTRVTMGNTVTNIGSDAFEGCLSLASITLGNQVASIGDYGFATGQILREIYCRGDAPALGNDVFSGTPNVTVSYLPGTTGWEATFGGQPTALWHPQIQTDLSGLETNSANFKIAGDTNQVVVVETATNLLDPVWMPVQVAVLADGTASFTDPQWTNYPGRFYRLRSP